MKCLSLGAVVVGLTAVLGPAATHTLAIAAARNPEPGKPFLQWIITLVVFGAIAAITFKNAKRTTND